MGATTMKEMDAACWRLCDLRSTTISAVLTGLSCLLFLARAWHADVDLAVTSQLASLAVMVAICVPLTYIPFVELHGHFQLQRSGRIRPSGVVDYRVNEAGFSRWCLDIEVPQGIVQKWAHCSSKSLAIGSTAQVPLSDNWVYCRVETPGKSVWRTTLYLTTLIFVSLTDTIESLYCVFFGIRQAVILLQAAGCSVLNIVMHLLFCVAFGGAVLSNVYVFFWRRRTLFPLHDARLNSSHKSVV